MVHPLLLLACVAGRSLAEPPLHPGVASASVQYAQQAWELGPEALEAWRAERSFQRDEDGMQVVAELAPGLPADVLLACLDQRASGAWAETWVDAGPAHGAMVQLWVPWALLGEVEACPGLRRLREPHRPRALYERSEGYDAMFSQDWHADGATGRGVEVAILDVGFAAYEDLLGNELPASVTTWNVPTVGGSTHGSAVAEIVHDIAPSADLGLYQFSTDVEFLEAVQAVADGKAHIVNASVGFDNIWHPDGTSPCTQAVDILVEDYGRTWVSAAGNENHRYRLGALSNRADDLVAIDGMSPVWVASSAGKAVVSLRWSEPFGEAGIDLDLALYDEDGNPCGGQGQGVDPQDGDDDPYEIVECNTGGGWAQAYVLANGNNVTGLEGFLYAYAGLDEADATGERNLTLPGDTRAGISVGAVDLPDTTVVASYSSRGPTDYDEIRPHLVAPAGVTTASYGAGQFSGTSAATPHVTGVAALVLHADRLSIEPSAVRDFLTDAAVDIGPVGQDHSSGAGFLVLEDVPWRGCHCAQVPGQPRRAGWLCLLLGCCGVFLRRRVSS